VARAIEMLISCYHHPLWTMLAATLFMTIGVGVLWSGSPLIAAALMRHTDPYGLRHQGGVAHFLHILGAFRRQIEVCECLDLWAGGCR
jgi:hypothetical protein